MNNSSIRELKILEKKLDAGDTDLVLESINQRLEDIKLSENEWLRLNLLKGRAFLNKGMFKDAERLAEEILKRSNEVLIDIDVLNIVSEACWRLGDYNRGLKYIKKVENKLQKIESPDENIEVLKKKAILNNNKGAIYWSVGDLKKALHITLENLEIRNQIKDKLGIACSLNNLGIIYLAMGDYNNAKAYSMKGLELAKELNDGMLLADLSMSLGSIYFEFGDYEKSLNNFEHALNFYEELNIKQNIASCLSNIGNIFHVKGEYEKAIDFYIDSLRIRKQIGNKQHIANSLNNIGLLYWEKGEYDKALSSFESSLTIRREIGNKKEITSTLSNIGNLLLNKGKLNESIKIHKICLSLRRELNNHQDIAASLNNLGNVLLNKGDLNESLCLFNQTLEIRKEIGNERLLSETYRLLGVLFQNRGDFTKAKEFLKTSLHLSRKENTIKEIYLALFNLISLLADEISDNYIDDTKNELMENLLRYFKELELLMKENDVIMINYYYTIAKALVLKSRENSFGKHKSRDILNKLLSSEKLPFILRILTLIRISEVILELYIVMGDDQYIEELEEKVDLLLKEGKNNNIDRLILLASFLKIKLKLFSYNLENVEMDLIRIKNEAERLGLTHIAKISEDELIKLKKIYQIATILELKEKEKKNNQEMFSYSFFKILRDTALKLQGQVVSKDLHK